MIKRLRSLLRGVRHWFEGWFDPPVSVLASEQFIRSVHSGACSLETRARKLHIDISQDQPLKVLLWHGERCHRFRPFEGLSLAEMKHVCKALRAYQPELSNEAVDLHAAEVLEERDFRIARAVDLLERRVERMTDSARFEKAYKLTVALCRLVRLPYKPNYVVAHFRARMAYAYVQEVRSRIAFNKIPPIC